MDTTFTNCAVLLTGVNHPVMEQVAKEILCQGGRVWLVGEDTDYLQEMFQQLAPLGPVDYSTCDFMDADACDALASLIFQTDGQLDAWVTLQVQGHPPYEPLASALMRTVFAQNPTARLIQWIPQIGGNPAPTEARDLRQHTLSALPSAAAIPHVLHLASTAGGSLQNTRLVMR